VGLVGSLPPQIARDTKTSLHWLIERVGLEAAALPFDRDPKWICQWLDELVRVETLRRVRRGGYSSYEDFSVYRVRRGHRLQPEDLLLGREQEVAEALAVYEDLAADLPQTLPPLQVSIPNSLDRILFAFLPDRGLIGRARGLREITRWLGVFTEATRGEIAAITRQVHDAGRELVLQLESPIVLGAFAKTPRAVWPRLARWLARQVLSLLRAAPHEQWVLHLCYGDLNKTPYVRPVDLTPVMLFANALAELCHAEGIPMPEVGIPVTVGDEAPPTAEEFFAPLVWLRRDVEVSAGLAAEHHPQASRDALALMEWTLGRPVRKVSRSCGYGRCTVADTETNLALCRELAAQPPDYGLAA
jgi:hypothetical protein